MIWKLEAYTESTQKMRGGGDEKSSIKVTKWRIEKEHKEDMEKGKVTMALAKLNAQD